MLVDPSPENLDRCTGVLGSAAARLGGVNRPPPSQTRDLRSAIHRARHLLELAADYHLHWQRVLQSMAAGYTSAGETAPFSARGRLSMEG